MLLVASASAEVLPPGSIQLNRTTMHRVEYGRHSNVTLEHDR
jgi:hypothetical protein